MLRVAVLGSGNEDSTVVPVQDENTFSVVAAPNISKGGETVHFRMVLRESAEVRLSIYSLLGEKIYSTTIEGQAGLNISNWETQSQGNQPVASGLYIYLVEVDGDTLKERRQGKVVVIR